MQNLSHTQTHTHPHTHTHTLLRALNLLVSEIFALFLIKALLPRSVSTCMFKRYLSYSPVMITKLPALAFLCPLSFVRFLMAHTTHCNTHVHIWRRHRTHTHTHTPVSLRSRCVYFLLFPITDPPSSQSVLAQRGASQC